MEIKVSGIVLEAVNLIMRQLSCEASDLTICFFDAGGAEEGFHVYVSGNVRRGEKSNSFSFEWWENPDHSTDYKCTETVRYTRHPSVIFDKAEVLDEAGN